MQNKIKAQLSQSELNGQLQRAKIIALFLVLVFSFLFNISLGLRP